MGAQFQQDHIVHFYHLHALDWVDVVNALKADPKKTAALADNVSNAPWGGAVYYKQVAQRLQTFVDSGRFRGTCYRASNWTWLGTTQGRGRMDRQKKRIGAEPKEVFVFCLTKNAAKRLCEVE